jgi:hypothetical protein
MLFEIVVAQMLSFTMRTHTTSKWCPQSRAEAKKADESLHFNEQRRSVLLYPLLVVSSMKTARDELHHVLKYKEKHTVVRREKRREVRKYTFGSAPKGPISAW